MDDAIEVDVDALMDLARDQGLAKLDGNVGRICNKRLCLYLNACNKNCVSDKMYTIKCRLLTLR